MTSHARFLKRLSHSSSSSPPSPTPATDDSTTTAVDSDFVVILAALLCALICVLGLVAVARCAWLRRFSGGSSAPANKGVKKKVLKSLPKVAYSPEQHAGKLTDECAICLSEFAAGEEIRVLPQCGHGFHVSCIDTWLGSHSSCPSCRQILGARCQKCGGGLPESGAGDCSSAVRLPPPSQSPPVRDTFLP